MAGVTEADSVEADAQIEVYSIHIRVHNRSEPMAAVSTIISWTLNLEIANGARYIKWLW